MSENLSASARQWVIRLALLIPIVVFPIYWFKVLSFTGYCDFDVYYKTALRLKGEHWGDIYNTWKDGSNPFRYSPPTLVFFRIFAEMPFTPARLIFYVLNFLGFGLGFIYLKRTLQSLKLDALLIVSITAFFSIRYMFDSFTIGQVSGLMFAGFSSALFYYVHREDSKAGNAILVPSIFKLTPVLFYALFRWTAIRASLLTLAILISINAVLICGFDRIFDFFYEFTSVLVSDDAYFNSSHYASQSLKSALLRFSKLTGVFTMHQVHEIWLVTALLTTFYVVYLWNSRKPTEPKGRLYAFSLGIFVYLFFMPQTFKYSMGFLAFPIAALLSSARTNPFSNRSSTLTKGTWIFFFIILGLGGKDVVGDLLFFGAQKMSLPFSCMVVMAFMTLREYQSTHASQFEAAAPEAFETEPLRTGTVPLSMLVVGSPEELQEWRTHRKPNLHSDVETIFVTVTENKTSALALREAFARSHGNVIAVSSPRNIVLCDFFERAVQNIQSGFDLVRSNRRLPDSEFKTPVKLLKVAYRRHLLSTTLNRWVQKILPIRTGDLFSGNFVVTRNLAWHTFANQSSTQKSFKLEFDLQAHGRGLKQCDLTATTLYLHENSLEFLLIEGIRLGLDIFRFRKKVHAGFSRTWAEPTRITSDDWGISPGVNDGILDLAKRKIVRRVSILATGDYVQKGLEELKKIPGIELGLHFDLTYQNKRGPLSALLYWFIDPQSRRESLTDLQNQITRLQQQGVSIAYIDGHHHMHLLPSFIDLAGPILKKAGIGHVRIPYDPSRWFSTKAILNLLALGAKKSCKNQGLKSHPCLYPSASYFKDPSALRVLLGKHPEHEIIVHPSSRDDFKEYSIADPFSAQRVIEYRALRQICRL